MQRRTLGLVTGLLAGVALAAGCSTIDKEIAMNQRASGPFDVKLGPLEPYNTDAEARLARYSIDKQFHGELDASSKGEMLSSGSAKDSGGYVAIERVTGTLH